MLDNIIKSIQILDDSMAIKTDYSKEIEELFQYESDIRVLGYLNTNRVKTNKAIEHINNIRRWISEEIAAR